MATYTCYILDDEPLALNVIEQHLSRFNTFEVVGKSTNPVQALSDLKHLQPDLLFIDIQMPEITGLEFIETIRNKPFIVITTAYREFAVQGFDLNVLDYLVKPISFKRFVQTIDKFLEQHKPSTPAAELPSNPCLFVKADRKVVRIPINEILYIEGIKDYVKIVLKEQRVLTKASITSLLESLPADRFARVHKSFIVALPMMTAYSAQGIEIGSVQIPIGRVYKQGFFEIMEGRSRI